jgi:hypothetical protein
MSGVISFGESAEEVWLVAGWAYRRLLGDVLTASAQDEKVAYAVQQAVALQGLDLPLIAREERELSVKLYKAIRNVAIATVQDSAKEPLNWKQGLDAAGQAMYLGAVRELLAILGKAGEEFG